jgi:hypothetical protein
MGVGILLMFGSKIERDPNIRKLEQDVFAQLQEIAKPLQPSIPDTSSVKFVSFEDALKELQQMMHK